MGQNPSFGRLTASLLSGGMKSVWWFNQLFSFYLKGFADCVGSYHLRIIVNFIR